MRLMPPPTDERAKLAVAVSTGIAALFCIHWQSQIAILTLAFFLGLFCGAYQWIAALVLAGATAGPGFFLTWLDAGGSTLTGTVFLLMALKFGPSVLTMVYLYQSLDTSRLLRALEQTGVPGPVLIPLGITFRFLPSFVREFTHIRDALAFRGLPLTWRTLVTRPLALMERLLVPLLMRALLIGEELARSALARGMGGPGRKTVYCPIRFSPWDTAFCLGWAAVLGLIVVWDRSGGSV